MTHLGFQGALPLAVGDRPVKVEPTSRPCLALQAREELEVLLRLLSCSLKASLIVRPSFHFPERESGNRI